MNQFQWNSRSIVNNLIMLNAVVFLAQFLSPKVDLILTQYLGLHALGSVNFYPHQFITYMFLHGSLSHLFFNMFALWMFGRILEYDLGPKRFLILYMVTGIGAGVLNMFVSEWEISRLMAQYSANDPGLIHYINTTVTIGASGAVFGILIAFGMLHPNDRLMLLIPPIPIKAKYFVMIYGALELVLGFSQPTSSIAHFAHIGGMLFGFLLLWYWKSRGKIYY